MKLWKPAALAAALTGAAAVGAAVAPIGHAQSARTVTPRNVEVFSLGGGRIGVTVSELDAADLKSGSGVRVDAVDEGSPAEKAGLRKGDIVVEFDGERVRSVRQFTRLVSETPAGRTVTAVAMRDGQRVTLTVVPRENDGFRVFEGESWRLLDELRGRRAPTPAPAPAPLPPAFEGLFRRSNQLGVTVETLTGQLAEYFGTRSGVLITSVQEDSLAARIGLKAGDVISAVNGATVDDATDLRRRMDRLEDGEEFSVTITRDRKSSTLKGKIEPTGNRRRSMTRTIL